MENYKNCAIWSWGEMLKKSRYICLMRKKVKKKKDRHAQTYKVNIII